MVGDQAGILGAVVFASLSWHVFPSFFFVFNILIIFSPSIEPLRRFLTGKP